MVSTDIWIWVYSLLTIAFFSQLYKDNAVYRLSEYTLVGVGAAHMLTVAYWNFQRMAIAPLLAGNYFWLFALILGSLLLFRLVPRYRWISNWPLAVTTGVGVGLVARGTIETEILTQITSTFALVKIAAPLVMFNSAIIIVGVFCTVAYFLFTIKPMRGMGTIATIGRYIMMAGFGANHAWSWLSRMASMISQLQVLVWDWLGIV